ncbi:rab-GTPase-TBC domain-containing protein [Naematelia encephala]|uniref:Rab-GTPase-TBC domain-containing protein n=1 Tax=Naematelia encephala TaxID=71784 RepID=A0A1Y2ARR5_9TREE|nr:rab-GTPase-TBC domain-containing protein [Naematelia encephala]
MAPQPQEEDLFARPDPRDIHSEYPSDLRVRLTDQLRRSSWAALFSDPLLSLSKLKSTALSKSGLGDTSPDGGVLLRSVYWRFYLGLLPPPTSLDLFAPHLQSTRKSYTALRHRYLVAPDGRWAADCTGADEAQSSTILPSGSGAGDGWDPLSLDGGSPWKTWFSHLDLRATIRQDVERTFPDMPYFQLESVRKSMTTALFLFSVLNPDVGYRQGMHELLATCYLAVDRDSLRYQQSHLEGSSEAAIRDEAMYATLDRQYVEHDAFGIFVEIMKPGKAFYEWRAEEGPVRVQIPPRPKNTAAQQAPIITRCNHIHNVLIRRIDPQLWERLESEGVEAQIWAIRWLRLIFTRELPFPLAMRIWDGVFADDPGLAILDYICVAMLLLIRNELLEADYPTLLTHLLHYPAPNPYPFSPYLILSQALLLRDDISPSSGVEVVIQNQDILGVSAKPPDRLPEEVRRPMRGGGGAAMYRGNGRGRGAPRGMQGLAAGLFERAQAAGLDKAIMSTVADLRRNLPDSAAAYAYLPNLPFSPLSPPTREASGSFSSIPGSASVLPNRSPFSAAPTYSARPALESRPSIDSAMSIKSLKDAELQMAELRLAMLGMGKAMAEWLETLQASPDDPSSIKGLERVRDTLLEAAGSEVEDIVREWGWHEGLEAPRSRSVTPGPDPPTPVKDSIALSASTGTRHSAPLPLDLSEAYDITPTAPEVDLLPDTPRVPTRKQVPVSAPPLGRPTDQPGPSRPTDKPALLLSSREDRPISTLPRVPISAPSPRSTPPPRFPADMQTGQMRASSTGPPLDGRMSQGSSKDQVANTSGDPLAGLGVSSLKRENSKKLSPAGPGSSSVDPLLGMGVR